MLSGLWQKLADLGLCCLMSGGWYTKASPKHSFFSDSKSAVKGKSTEFLQGAQK
jgi:hypothetical protein